MPKKKGDKKKKRAIGSADAAGDKRARDAAPPPPPPGETAPRYEDDFEDEFIDEEMVDDEAVEGEAAARAAVAADDAAGGGGPRAVRDPRENSRAAGDLECDPRAYKMLHRLGSDWPCLSFDVVPDGGGGGRTRFPHALLAACGTQAGERDADRLTFLRLEGLGRMDLSDDDDDDASDDDDDDGEGNATAEHVAIPHPGGVNRVAACARTPGLVATWSDRARVHVWDARDECAALCASGGPRPAGLLRRPPAASLARPAEGFALQWRNSEDCVLACGDNAGSVVVAKCGADGRGLTVDAEWRPEGPVEDVAWSPTEPTVLMTCGARANAIRVLDSRRPGDAMLARPDAHGAEDVNALAWNASVAYLAATAGDDGACRVWDLRRFGPGCPSVGCFDYHAGSHLAAVQWDPADESALALCAGGALDAVSLWDLSVEDDAPPGAEADCDVPPQLLFVHQGLDDPKEVKFHPQIPKLLMTTAADGFNVFIPNI